MNDAAFDKLMRTDPKARKRFFSAIDNLMRAAVGFAGCGPENFKARSATLLAAAEELLLQCRANEYPAALERQAKELLHQAEVLKAETDTLVEAGLPDPNK